MRLRSCSLWERCVSDDVAESLSLGLILLKHLSLGVVADDLVVDEAGEVQHLGTELRHDGGVYEGQRRERSRKEMPSSIEMKTWMT